MEIKDLQPQSVWQNFHLLTQIPRPSGHLEKIQEFLLQWAKERNIEAFKDNAGNIVMRKPATPGYEDLKMVTLEAHMDMVPQKGSNSTHNFLTDPIETRIDGDWVKANDTTLGSDDGMGVATAMAVLEDPTIEHGPIEALITADEETSMVGVNNLKADTLKGEILLNLDNETEGEFILGCAGGQDVLGELDYQEEAASESDIVLKVSLKGCKGGHSGLEIPLGRANANKQMARIMLDIIEEFDADLVSWKGGDMRNAIPRSAEVVITISPDDKSALEALCEEWQATLQSEFAGIEDELEVTVETIDSLPEGIVPTAIRDNLLCAINACPNGPLRNIPSLPQIVETSCNLGIITIEKGHVTLDVLTRSSCETMLDNIGNQVRSTFLMAGLSVSLNGRYPAWQPNWESPIAATVKETYRKLFNEDCKIEVVHAGLECGIIQITYPAMDAISFGPTLRSPHTPMERCNIPSVARYFEFVKALLVNIPKK